MRGDAKLWPQLLEIMAEPAPKGRIQACHTPQHYKFVERAVSEGRGYLDADTIVSPRSWDAALRAAGAACQGVDAVMSGAAVERIKISRIKAVYFTNSIPLKPDAEACERIKTRSVAPLLAQAIQSIHEETSVSTLFL